MEHSPNHPYQLQKRNNLGHNVPTSIHPVFSLPPLKLIEESAKLRLAKRHLILARPSHQPHHLYAFSFRATIETQSQLNQLETYYPYQPEPPGKYPPVETTSRKKIQKYPKRTSREMPPCWDDIKRENRSTPSETWSQEIPWALVQRRKKIFIVYIPPWF